jgi:hypothetical protein
MLADYQDILDHVSKWLRYVHEQYLVNTGRTYPDCVRVTRAGHDGEFCGCTVEPFWWDQNGVPRYFDHHPKLCPDIYADEVILLEVECQACQRKFPVQMSWGMRDKLAAVRRNAASDGPLPTIAKLVMEYPEQIHYGDPPIHGTCSGNTMNVNDLRILEFWSRLRNADRREWARVPDLELNLPDLTGDEC